MSIVVQKYGGSSVADVAKLHLVAEKVVTTRAAGHDVVVVVSAMGKTTDELLALAREVDTNPPRRELDMLLSAGERMSMALLSMAIQKRGAPAISFTGSQSGIITNDRHFDARIIDVRPHRVEDELHRGRVVIIAGYQGMSYKREVTTLGRGGSDTTAIAMAAALGASHAEIYSDVDGVYSADPRVVPDAQHLPELRYDEMGRMASAGAKVLHGKAVAMAQEARIAIRARSTFRPGKETHVHQGAAAPSRPCAVVGDRGQVELRFARHARGFEGALDALAEAGVDASFSATEDVARIRLRRREAPDWSRLAEDLVQRFGAGVHEGHGTVTVVGGQRAEVARAVGDLVPGATGMTCDEASVRITLPDAQVDEAVRALHARLVTREGSGS
ncbi:MAG: aspartate kinase [Myxococcota bacterium]